MDNQEASVVSSGKARTINVTLARPEVVNFMFSKTSRLKHRILEMSLLGTRYKCRKTNRTQLTCGLKKSRESVRTETSIATSGMARCEKSSPASEPIGFSF